METVLFLLNKKIATDHYLNIGTLREYAQSIEVYIKKGESSIICFTPTYLLGKSLKNEIIDKALKNANMLIPEGNFLIKNLKLRHKLNISKISRTSLVASLIKTVSEENVCLIYSQEKSIVNFVTKNPKIKIIQYTSDVVKMASSINEVGRPLIIVNLPESEQIVWMSEMKGKIKASMIGMGKPETSMSHRLWHSYRFLSKLWF